jgi:hypothetical protein
MKRNKTPYKKSYRFETVLLKLLVTQILAPSNAMPRGAEPTSKVPRFAPSLARSLVTLLESLAVPVAPVVLLDLAVPEGLPE